MCRILSIFGSISDMIVAVAAGLAVIFSAIALFFSRITFRHQILNDLFREYRSPEMGMVIRRMHEFYSEQCEENEEKLVAEYVKAYKEESKIRKSIHFQRRQISGFFQQIAALSDKDAIYRSLVYKMWKKDDLKIIPDILIPIETKAIPIALGNQPAENEKDIKESFKRMLRFYRNAPEN